MRGEKQNTIHKNPLILTMAFTIVILLILANLLPLAKKDSNAASSFQANYDSGSLDANFSLGSGTASTDTSLPSLTTGYNSTNSLSYSYDGTSTLKYATASNLPVDKGSVEMKFQKSAYGSSVDQDAGSMNRPGGIAYDPVTEYVYVADTQNHRIIKTKIDGTGWQSFGQYGTGIGQFNYPIGIRYVGGYLYIADKGNSRIIKTKFDGSGWEAKTGFNSPRDLEFDGSTGDIYVANYGGGNVIKFRFGTSNWNTLSISAPVGIYYESATEYLYLAREEATLTKIKFDGSGQVNKAMLSRSYGFGGSILSYGLYSDPVTGYVYTTFQNNGSGGSIAKLKMDGSEYYQYDGFDRSAASAYDSSTQMFYVAHANQYSATIDQSYISKSQIDKTGWTTYGSYYNNPLKFSNGIGNYYDPSSGFIYIADYNNNRIVKTKMDGSGWQTLGGLTAGNGAGQFNGPISIAYNSSTDYLYVCDYNNSRIVKTKIDGTGWTTYGSSGSGVGQFAGPNSVSYDYSSDHLYISDSLNHRIVKTKIDGTGWTTYGSSGSGVGQFSITSGIYYDQSSSDIYIVDWRNNYRIVKTKIDGTGWTTFGSNGGGIGQFSYPTAIWHDSGSNYLYILDGGNSRIVKTQIDFSGWTTYGTSGSGVGQFNTSYGWDPWKNRGLTYDSSTGYIYINDMGNNRLVRTKIDGTGWQTTNDFTSKEKILYSAQSTDDSRLVYDVLSRKLRFYLAYSNKAQFVETDTLNLTDGEWYTVKAHFNKANFTLSIDLNGEEVATKTYDSDWGSLSYGTSFYIGARNGSTTDRWDGMIDDINVNIESVDTVAPTNPTAGNTHFYYDATKAVSFTSDNWGNSQTPYITWSGATDASSGLKGYYLYFGTDNTAEPNSTSGLLTPNLGARYFKTHEGVDGAEQNITVPANTLVSGVTYYLILSTQDNDLNTAEKTSLFTYKYDGAAPEPPEVINASPVGCSTSSTFTFTWDAITDPLSGIAGYEYKNGSSGTITDAGNVGTLEKAPYQEGDNIIYIRTKDNAGNTSSWQTAVYCSTGIAYLIDGPTVVAGPSSITVNWTSNKPTTSSVKVYDGNTYISEQGQTSYDINHSVKVIGLKPEKSYKYRLAWADQNANISESEWYETTTTQAPAIRDLEIKVLTPTEATAIWKTSYPAECVIEYGIGRYESSIKIDGSAIDFSRSLSNLEGGKSYLLRVRALTDDNTEFVSERTFETPPKPLIFGVRFEPVKDQVMPAVRVFWSTNVETTSGLTYGLRGQSSRKDISNNNKTKEHVMMVEKLDDDTTYELFVTGVDGYGNTAQSDKHTFKTDFDTRPPAISQITIETSNVGLDKQDKAQIAVSWRTDEPTTSQVEYGEGIAGSEYTNKTTEDKALTTNHLVIIPELTPGKPYHIRVISTDKGNNTTLSKDHTVIPGDVPRSALQIILNTFTRLFGWMGLN